MFYQVGTLYSDLTRESVRVFVYAAHLTRNVNILIVTYIESFSP